MQEQGTVIVHRRAAQGREQVCLLLQRRFATPRLTPRQQRHQPEHAAEAVRRRRQVLRLDGRAIAMLANFITPPGAYSFKTAFDEAYARFSPGMLLQLENLVLLERPDVAWADSCAVEGHPMIERLWRDKRHMVSRNIAIGGPLRRAAFRLLMAYETRPRSTS